MVKDRLPELQSRRSSTPKSRSKGVADRGSTGPVFLDKFSNLSHTINELQKHINEIERLQLDILASPQTNAELDESLHRLTIVVKDKAYVVRSELKNFEQDLSDHTYLLTSAEDRMKSSQYAALTRQLVDLMNRYSRLQLDYREKCKARIRGKLTVAGSVFSEQQLEEMLENKNPQIFTQAIMADTDAAKRSLCDIEARHADIIQLEKSIEELRELFVTIALNVDHQSELIDRVEYNVSKAVDAVTRGRDCLSNARKQRKKNLRRKTICIIILLVVALMAIITIASAIGLT